MCKETRKIFIVNWHQKWNKKSNFFNSSRELICASELDMVESRANQFSSPYSPGS